MSYEIIFETLALEVPREDFVEQVHQFAIERLGVDLATLQQAENLGHELVRLCRQHKLPTPPMGTVYMLHMLIGCNNVIDSETNQVARSWQFCGIGSEYELITRFGCQWAEDVEGGSIKPNGRWTLAENWIRALRKKLKDALNYSAFPYCRSLSVYVDKPLLDEIKETDRFVFRSKALPTQERFELLQKRAEVMGATVKEASRFGEEKFEVVMYPKSAFEMWLFQRMIFEYQGECWINGSEPPSHIVKRQAR
ncbi:hypothetical protein [Vibrio parahaemolyticus]